MDSTPSAHLAEHAKELLARIVLPKRIGGSTVERYVRKATRLGIWRRLPPETRALLLILRRWGLIRSPTLVSILRRVFLEIELCTLRGKALFYGIVLSLRDSMAKLRDLIRNVTKLLILGLSYLNRPTMYRAYD